MKIVHIEAILMPNGEVISCGRTLGFEKDFMGTWGKSAIKEVTSAESFT